MTWHVLHPIYFFAALMLGGAFEGVVAAIPNDNQELYNWKMRLVNFSLGSVIVFSTLINMTHSDSKVLVKSLAVDSHLIHRGCSRRPFVNGSQLRGLDSSLQDWSLYL